MPDMEGNDAVAFASAVSPTLASWSLGDKTGAAVEKVTGIARDILGTDDPTGIEAVTLAP